MRGAVGRGCDRLRPRRLAGGVLLIGLVIPLAACALDTLVNSPTAGKAGDRAADLMLAIDGSLPPSPGLPTVIEVSRTLLPTFGDEQFEREAPAEAPPPAPAAAPTAAPARQSTPPRPPAPPRHPPLFEPPAASATPWGVPYREPAQGARPASARVALLLPLSGPNRALGEAMLNAAQLALYDIADDRLMLLPYDTGGSPRGAIRVARQAVYDGVGLILGPVFAAAARQVAPIARGAGLNVISFSNDRSIAGDNVYVMGFLPDDQVASVVDFALRQGLARFAALVPSTPYGDTVVATLQRMLAQWGGELSRVTFYQPTDEDIAPTVRELADYDNRAKALEEQRQVLEEMTDPISQQALKHLEGLETIGDVGFDAVLLSEGGDRLKAIAPLLPYYDIDPSVVRFLGTAQWDDPDLGQEPALLGGWFAAPPVDTRADFMRRYREVFGHQPMRLVTLAYDATALAAVLARAEGGPDFGTASLTVSRGFAGIDGIFRFLPDGVIQRGLAIMQVHKDGPRVIREAPQYFDTLATLN